MLQMEEAPARRRAAGGAGGPAADDGRGQRRAAGIGDLAFWTMLVEFLLWREACLSVYTDRV
ncbi:hypothetical protein LJR269_006516 [Duganella sp. LjRoot269]